MKHSFRGALLCLVSAIGLLAVACVPNTGPGGGTPNLSPLAVANATPNSGDAPLSVAFSSAGSSDADGTIASYSWNFGDGSPVETAQHPTHTYTAVATSTATLTVVDNAGASASTTVTITTSAANVAPTAVAGGTPTTGKLPLEVAFSSTGSTDSDGPIASYAWDFGDPASGAANTSADPSPAHTYAAAGGYTATLTVTDDDGATGTATVGVTVSANQAPVVIAAASPSSGKAPLLVTFDSSGTMDPDGPVVSYAWDFGDPASGAANTSTDPAPTHTYAVGTFTATLTATDDSGDSNTATVMIHALANVAPVAALTASVTSGVAHLPVTFDSAGSTDADGSISSVAWDFGDGHTSAAASAQNLYTVAGTYTATLTVTDGDGATGTTTQTITVTNNPDGRYVATTGTDAGTCLVSASPCRTVQYAVNQADASGDTVYLSSGAYPEIAYVAKDVAFKGANQGIPAGATPGTRRAESIVKGLRTGTAAASPGAPQRQITIDGIGVDPQGDVTLISGSLNKPLVWLTGGSANVVKNSTFSGGPYVPGCSFNSCTTMSDMGLEIRSGGAVVANNSFENFRRVANFYQTAATGTLFTTVSFTGNKMTHFTSRGLQIAPSGGNPSVAGVTVDGNVFDATGFTAPSSPGSIIVTTGANTYTNNTFIGASSGIYLYLCTAAYVVGAQHISSNTFTNNGTAVVVFTENPATCPTAHIDGTVISGNSFAGNAGGIGVGSAATYFANGAGPIDVSCNWWGAATGPNTAGAATATASASVITSPWRTSLNGACDGV